MLKYEPDGNFYNTGVGCPATDSFNYYMDSFQQLNVAGFKCCIEEAAISVSGQ